MTHLLSYAGVKHTHAGRMHARIPALDLTLRVCVHTICRFFCVRHRPPLVAWISPRTGRSASSTAAIFFASRASSRCCLASRSARTALMSSTTSRRTACRLLPASSTSATTTGTFQARSAFSCRSAPVFVTCVGPNPNPNLHRPPLCLTAILCAALGLEPKVWNRAHLRERGADLGHASSGAGNHRRRGRTRPKQSGDAGSCPMHSCNRACVQSCEHVCACACVLALAHALCVCVCVGWLRCVVRSA